MKRQIDFDTAMELAKRGKDVFTLVPADSSASWAFMEPGTLQEMLEGVLFFEETDEPVQNKQEAEASTLEWLQKRFEVAK